MAIASRAATHGWEFGMQRAGARLLAAEAPTNSTPRAFTHRLPFSERDGHAGVLCSTVGKRKKADSAELRAVPESQVRPEYTDRVSNRRPAMQRG